LGLKKRNKVSAEFSMSSLTDIIFLLLIFFMLTSSMIQITMELPKSDSRTVAPTTVAVTLFENGDIQFNGKKSTKPALNRSVRESLAAMDAEEKKDATLTIISEVGVPWEEVYDVMTIANSNRMRAIIATQPNK
jgi:biopolymer transport protein ExbD